jgi:hypothetical protein
MRVSLVGVVEDGTSRSEAIPRSRACPLRVPWGEALDVVLSVVGENGAPRDLSTGTPTFSLSIAKKPGNPVLLSKAGAALPSVASNAVLFTVAAADYAKLFEPGSFVFDVWMTQASARLSLVPTSRFYVEPAVGQS